MWRRWATRVRDGSGQQDRPSTRGSLPASKQMWGPPDSNCDRGTCPHQQSENPQPASRHQGLQSPNQKYTPCIPRSVAQSDFLVDDVIQILQSRTLWEMLSDPKAWVCLQAASREHKYVLCVDDDVYLHPTTLRDSVFAMEQQPEAFMATGKITAARHSTHPLKPLRLHSRWLMYDGCRVPL